MKRLSIGILAHVDAGKTTLSEGMLYLSGALKKLGRVDHGSAFLDNFALERERGITIFSKQAVLPLEGAELMLLDTPGHVDFSSEMERTLQVLDYAILVVSGCDGVQGHTETLWRLLAQYQIPTLLFVNKMDLSPRSREDLLTELQTRLGEGFVDFSGDWQESAALCGEEALEYYLEHETLTDGHIQHLLSGRKLFPCWFGSALKLEGVEDFLSGLERFTQMPDYPAEFGARVYKIARDLQGTRLTYLKVTGGVLKARAVLQEGEKADQLRLYSGEKFQQLAEAPAGTVCAVTGLSQTRPGQGLGFEADGGAPVLEPVLTYRLQLPAGCDPYIALPKLRQLEEEDPQLHLLWNEARGEIHIQLMGEVQLEILQRLILERFGWAVTFDEGSIVYKETIETAAEGVGHFEPLRHYAEVHLLLEPGPPGSGLRLATACPTDQLDLNWQRLILTHLMEKPHRGVLTGAPVTDIKITLIAGRAHIKHTEGGDFRQATYRAVRQGLMQVKSRLLEPWYDVRLEVPASFMGRAMSDLQRMSGQVDPPDLQGDRAVLTGGVPVAALGDYWREVVAYTQGQGRLSCALRGYEPCHNSEEIIAASGYQPERDVDNPAGSVFCSHGAGVTVPWDEVFDHMHVESPLARPRTEEKPDSPPVRTEAPRGSLEQDKELLAIFERTYGKVETKAFQPQKKPARTSLDDSYREIRTQRTGPEYLLVDGYNIIFAWDELKAIAQENVAAAREALLDLLSNYKGFRQCEVILVFDAYKVKGNPGSIDKTGGVYVVYTKEAETADAYIEKTTYELGKNHRVRVATSDGLEQLIILGHGALRLSAAAFHQEMEQAAGEIARAVARHNQRGLGLDKLKHTANIRKKP